MPLDDELVKAIKESVHQVGQPDTVAKRLIAWLEAMTTTEISNEDESRYLENIRLALEIESQGDQ